MKMKNALTLILKFLIFLNLLSKILCGDKTARGNLSPPENKTAKNANLEKKSHEIGATTSSQMKKVPFNMATSSTNAIGRRETAKKQNPKNSTGNKTPEEKASSKTSSKSSPNELGKNGKEKVEESSRKKKQKQLELMPCYRGGISKNLKSNSKKLTTNEQKTTAESKEKNVPKSNRNLLAEGTAVGQAKNKNKQKIGENLSKSADFEDSAAEDKQMLARQNSKSMDLEEYLQKYEQMQKSRQKKERMEKAKKKKEQMAQKRELEKEKQRAKAIAHGMDIRMRQQQQQPSNIAFGRSIKSRNVSASSSKQSDDRRLKMVGGPQQNRPIGEKAKIRSTKPNDKIDNDKADSKQKMSPAPEDDNNSLPNSENWEAKVEEALKKYLDNLNSKQPKIPTTQNENVHEMIRKTVDQYHVICDLFVESMQKMLGGSTKDHGAVQRINQLKMDIEKDMDTLKYFDTQDDLAPIQLFYTREWLLAMKKNVEKMLRKLSGRPNYLLLAAAEEEEEEAD